jgi:hypothetical protein
LPSEIIFNGVVGRIPSRTNIQSHVDDTLSLKSERSSNIKNQKSKISDVKFTCK